jgi:hypothetical protein
MNATISVGEQLKRDAEQARVAGIPFNPKLPANFDNAANDRRPASHRRWWNRPFISTEICGEADPFYTKWLQAWPLGIRYEVRCLDGGAWDRPTCWGMFKTVEEAIQRAGGATS